MVFEADSYKSPAEARMVCHAKSNTLRWIYKPPADGAARRYSGYPIAAGTG